MKKYLFLFAPLLSLQAIQINAAGDFLNLYDALKRDDIKAVNEYFSSHPKQQELSRPLHVATQLSRNELVRQFLESGSNVNELDGFHRPAISYVTDPAIAQILLSVGADPSITFDFKDKDKPTKGTVLDYLNVQLSNWEIPRPASDSNRRKLINLLQTKRVIENYIKSKPQAQAVSTSSGKAEIA